MASLSPSHSGSYEGDRLVVVVVEHGEWVVVGVADGDDDEGGDG